MTALKSKTGPMTGRVVSRYRVGDLLGAGGMGVVYRGQDLRLGRPVALKFLRDGMGEDATCVERLRREARTASVLNHPHICTIHDVENLEGRPFLVMELLEGETLARRLRRGPLPLIQVLELGVQLADALAEAHRKGVIHRDLKPGNVFVTRDGRLKIVDFGIARRHRDVSGLTTSVRGLRAALIDGVEVPTASGLAGTLPYMAPEQVHERRVDSRSDLFSLGVVLYEMATGRRVFEGGSAREILDAVCAHVPPPPSRLVPDLPGALDAPIMKALEKSPDQRYQSASEIHAELVRLRDEVRTMAGRRRSWLRRLAGASPRQALLKVVTPRWRAGALAARPPVRTSVAVVPVRALSSGPEGDLLADGMTDALVARLSQNEAVRVVSITSVMRYKGTTTSTPEIGRTLQVDGLVEGCLLLSGERVRISVRVVEAVADRCVWSRVRESGRNEALALQDELAREVAQEISVTPAIAFTQEDSGPALPCPGVRA